MKIVLVQNAQYVPTLGGANKANKIILECLAERGHECHAVATATGVMAPGTCSTYMARLEARGIGTVRMDEGSVQFRYRDVSVIAAESSSLRTKVLESLRSIKPDVVLVSSEDAFYILLQTALEEGVGSVIYFAHTTAMLPFGPAAFARSSRGVSLLRKVDAIITISAHVRDYILSWGSCNAVKITAPLFGAGPFPHWGHFGSGQVLMINPCAFKGITIFLDLVRAFPEISFAAVPTWGTNQAEWALLRSNPNLIMLEPVEGIDELLKHTKILLVPSLWDEGFGLIVVEAMLRGIPVMASAVGGLPEAKLGVDYLLPVNPIKEYRGTLDSRLLPHAVIPSQDTQPWRGALHKLLTDRSHYEQISHHSYSEASNYVSGLFIDSLEQTLKDVIDRKAIA